MDPESPLLDEIARHTPLVIVDRTRADDHFCSAAADDVAGGRMAVEHLIDRGHERVAFIGGPASIGQVRERHQGALEAWLDAGLPAEALTQITTGALGFGDGREAGQSVPGDLAIVGFDDIDFAAAAAVPLTSVRQPRHELGRAAAELLLDEAGNPDHRHQQARFTPELIARESTSS